MLTSLFKSENYVGWTSNIETETPRLNQIALSQSVKQMDQIVSFFVCIYILQTVMFDVNTGYKVLFLCCQFKRAEIDPLAQTGYYGH